MQKTLLANNVHKLITGIKNRTDNLDGLVHAVDKRILHLCCPVKHIGGLLYIQKLWEVKSKAYSSPCNCSIIKNVMEAVYTIIIVGTTIKTIYVYKIYFRLKKLLAQMSTLLKITGIFTGKLPVNSISRNYP